MGHLECDFNHKLNYSVTVVNVVYVLGCESQGKLYGRFYHKTNSHPPPSYEHKFLVARSNLKCEWILKMLKFAG